ncbi:MAG: M3 family oligoendopeptidase [Nitrospira sp.]|nr:M3 family oligoendopeptidase [Nitrospira sp.]
MAVSRKTASATVSPRRSTTSREFADRWELADLVADPVKQFDRYLKDLTAKVTRFEAARPDLSPTMSEQNFLNLLALSEQIARDSGRLGAYSYLWFSEDTKQLQARSFKTKVEEHLTSLQNRLLFFDLWWQSVDEKNAERLMANSGDFRYHLETIRRFKPHTLSEPEEKIINIKNITGQSAVHQLYDVVTNGFTFTLRVGGKNKTMNREALTAYLRSPKAAMREAAYQEMYRVYESQQDLLGEIYKTLINDWKAENLQLRHFKTPLASRNLSNDIPDSAVEALLAVCMKNAPIFQRYFKLKAKLCKISTMNRYHLYAPHRAEQKTYRYPDAVRMVLDAYYGFSPRLAELAQRVFADRHIDARMKAGKMGGAYCYSVTPNVTPYVMLNFTGEARDIATMAHELGHAVHAMMAEQHTVFTFHSTLPLAETASVFGERILSDALMASESSKSVKQSLLVNQLDDIYATVMRQAYFVAFERTAHEMVAQGATTNDLASAYMSLLKQQFGKSLRVPQEFQWEWLTIPHLYASPFYCYAYSFGNLLVLALYRMYQEQGGAFVPKYLDLLAAGGSKAPQAILSQVGVDMNSHVFWQSGFDAISGMVDQLEETMR